MTAMARNPESQILTIRKDDKILQLFVSPPGNAELYAFRRWVRSRLKSQTVPLSQLGLDQLSAADRKTLIDSYVRHCAASQPQVSADDIMDLTQTPEGCAQMVWLCSRGSKTVVKLIDIQTMIDESNVDQVLGDFDAATGIADSTAGGQTPDEPATTPAADSAEDETDDEDEEPGQG